MKAWILAAAANAALVPAAFAHEDKPCRLEMLERAATTDAATGAVECASATSREGARTQAQSHDARRRSGSRIPDTELIGPRLVL